MCIRDRPPVEIELFLKNLKINPQLNAIRDAILPEVFERLNFMSNVGLEYLSLNRETASLSGGESQRIRLAGQLGSNLSGVLYVLDEPSIGLHPSDNQKLIDSLRSLQKKGNSLLVVEHDQETILQADCIIEIGPNAGEHGGHIVEMGKPAAVAQNGLSGTGKYLSLGISHPIRGNWRKLAPFRKNKEKAYVELSKVTFISKFTESPLTKRNMPYTNIKYLPVLGKVNTPLDSDIPVPICVAPS